MATRLTDSEIHSLLRERKNLPSDYLQRFRTKPKSGHEERELDLKGTSNSDFRVILRKSMYNTFDFSVILAYCVPGSTQVFRLRRYNGKSHEHTNAIEKETFYAFHIHTATDDIRIWEREKTPLLSRLTVSQISRKRWTVFLMTVTSTLPKANRANCSKRSDLNEGRSYVD